ncbi:hypothetical protein H072_11513 [Dactylellina haptotyla CBS 200.50]|uniref:Uncharacterized protein n=1 Tax=Dactylellina haptotyla (strain CBS 200.50) TaxID=1284197 RepID=S8B822_DACHA|nr:hypothetical protein H072_11513 [Dactylellina haptotyla CBS 200.50]
MAPTSVLSASNIKDAVVELYVRSAEALWGATMETAMNNSIEKRAGYVKPSDISKGVIAIFAILGGAMAGSVWWFFLKQGGFVWKEEDWDDYKSSVMRRKGPDGKTISSGSTRAPDTVVTDLTYQTEGTNEYDARTEKESHAGRETPKAKWAKKPKRNNSKRSVKSTFSMFGRWRRRDRSPTGTERDADLESYADEEPARMRSYNPYPVQAPSVISESDIASEAQLEKRGTSFNGAGRHPSRYAYTYEQTETASERSAPMGPRQSTKKSKRSESSRSAPKRQPTQRVAAQPELSTIADETETRLSFEAEDDAAFTAYSESIAPPAPTYKSPSKKAAASGSRGTRGYPQPPAGPSQGSRRKNQYSSSSRTGRKHSAGTYQTASTDTSDSDCASDCSCCTTDSDSDSDDGVSTTLSTRFRESARGDLGTKVYHHPLAMGLEPKRISSPVPTGQIMMGKQRGKQPPNTDRRVVAARSYRKESRGSLSSDSEGDSGGETVVSRVKKALNGQR